MSGHSKWSTIKRKKGVNDAKRGKVFTQLIREISMAARTGGGDPNANPRLRLAMDKARAQNMPKDNVERAIARGSGDAGGADFEEIRYEGYGPGGVAVIVDALTDNRNRTAGEVRHLFAKFGGNLGASGCVSYMFDRRGVLVFDVDGDSSDALIEAAIEADALDVREDEGSLEVITDQAGFEAVRDALQQTAEPASAEVQMLPQTTVELRGSDAETMLRLMEALDEHDDISQVYANFDISDEELRNLA